MDPFKKFIRRTLKPGPILDLEGKPLDVRALENVRGLTAISNRENNWLPELELVPLPIDDVPALQARSLRRWRDWLRPR